MNRVLIVSRQAKAYGQYLANQLELPIDALEDTAWVWPKLAEGTYALLIIDIGLLDTLLPAANALPQIFASQPTAGILLLAQPNERSRAVSQLGLGAADYLLYPFELIELAVKVRRCLSTRAATLPANITTAANTPRRTDNVTPPKMLQNLQLEKILAQASLISQADVAKIWLGGRNKKLVEPALLPVEEQLLFKIAQQVAQTGQPVANQFALGAEALTSVLLLPLVSGDRLIGVLALGKKTGAPFTANQLDTLGVFCQQAAVAIENAQLFHDLSLAYDDLAQSRKEILQSRNTLQTVFNNIKDGFYILNRDLTIYTLNRVESDRHGYPAEDLVGQSFLSLTGLTNSSTLIRQIQDSLDTGQEYTWVPSGNCEGNFFVNREFKIYPIKNRSDHTEQVVVFAQDVSERQRWQATLFRSANLAAVGQFAGSVAHQINNPLTVVMTNSQLITLDAEPGSEIQDLAAGVFRAGQRIHSSVSNLLEFSNQGEYYFAEVDLIGSIESALELVIRSLMKANVQVEKDFQARPTVFASVSHLKLVWVNLLLNARDAVANFAATPKIVIGTRLHQPDTALVTFTDNGVGLGRVDLKQAFNPFFSTKAPNKAMGLGLYSVQVIIEEHGGHIEVNSEPGVVTTFQVTLPLKKTAANKQ